MNRRLFLNRVGRHTAAIGAAGWTLSVRAADEGLSARHITIGSSLALSGPLANAGAEHTNGIVAAFASINKAGGINGRELRLLSKDDGYVAARTAANVKQMVDDNAVFAMMSVMGTPNTASILPLVEKAGVPLLGPITGATSLRKAEHRVVFHVRPSYADEVRRMVQQLVQMGLHDIAVVYLDNPFGKEVLAEAQRVLEESQRKAVAAIPLAVDGSNAAQAVQQVLSSRAGAVFMGTTGTGSTDFVLALRDKAAGMPVIGLSVTFTDRVRLGKSVAGLASALVFPPEQLTKFVVVREYLASLDASRLQNPAGLGLESWINAQIMAEGLRRVGRELTRDKLRAALAGLHGFNVGEVAVNFGATGPFVGTSSVKLGIFGPDGLPRI